MFVLSDILDLLVELQIITKDRQILNLLSRVKARLLEIEKADILIDQYFLIDLKEIFTMYLLNFENRKVEFNKSDLTKINNKEEIVGKRKNESFNKLKSEHFAAEVKLKHELDKINSHLEKILKI